MRKVVNKQDAFSIAAPALCGLELSAFIWRKLAQSNLEFAWSLGLSIGAGAMLGTVLWNVENIIWNIPNYDFMNTGANRKEQSYFMFITAQSILTGLLVWQSFDMAQKMLSTLTYLDRYCGALLFSRPATAITWCVSWADPTLSSLAGLGNFLLPPLIQNSAPLIMGIIAGSCFFLAHREKYLLEKPLVKKSSEPSEGIMYYIEYGSTILQQGLSTLDTNIQQCLNTASGIIKNVSFLEPIHSASAYACKIVTKALDFEGSKMLLYTAFGTSITFFFPISTFPATTYSIVKGVIIGVSIMSLFKFLAQEERDISGISEYERTM